MASRVVQLVDGPGADRWITLPIGSDGATPHVVLYTHRPARPGAAQQVHQYIQTGRSSYGHVGLYIEEQAA